MDWEATLVAFRSRLWLPYASSRPRWREAQVAIAWRSGWLPLNCTDDRITTESRHSGSWPAAVKSFGALDRRECVDGLGGRVARTCRPGDAPCRAREAFSAIPSVREVLLAGNCLVRLSRLIARLNFMIDSSN